MERVMYRRGSRLHTKGRPYLVSNGNRVGVRVDLPENTPDWYGVGMAKLYHVDANYVGVKQPIVGTAQTAQKAEGEIAYRRAVLAVLLAVLLLSVFIIGRSAAAWIGITNRLDQTEYAIAQAQSELAARQAALQEKINSVNIPIQATAIGMVSSASMEKIWLTLDSGADMRSAVVHP